MKLGMYFVLMIMTFMFALVGCNSYSPFGENLENSNEVLVKGERFEKKITDADKISSLVDVMNKSKVIALLKKPRV
ncbi:hypothetical protein DNH61_01380 [Paenibacillus sambharensis]|uniref:Uncharacterized protein n=1 Tax=Paenibacillus sambharensis TaxID=1803190 RepID=A0A2W1LRG3_9BACL|nr:hypothetical protein [Paenibacillus sambharensis]PZD97552.1 hypothetical protein DNH61_01380 [Paenibacillus sambharensis]